MQIGVPKETWPGELRTALVPLNAKKFIGAGFSICVESGAGEAAGFRDADYQEVGVSISDRATT
jgi:NAD(P) transhydrogenase subunit alpha